MSHEAWLSAPLINEHIVTMPLSRESRRKIRQTQLSFSPLPSSSPSKSAHSKSVEDRLASVRYSTAPRRHGAESKHNSSQLLPTPEASSQPEDDPLVTSFTHQHSPDHGGGSDEDDDEDVPVPQSKRRRITRGSKDHEIPHTTPSHSFRRTRHNAPENADNLGSRVPARSSQADLGLSDIAESESSGDEGQILTQRPTKRQTNSNKACDTFVLPDNDDSDQFSSNNTPPRRRPSNVRRGQEEFVVDDDVIELVTSEEDGENITATIQQKTPKKLSSTQRKRSRKVQEELEDDLADLQDSDTPQRPSRTRGGPVTTERDKAKAHFDLLRRRRAGEVISREEYEDEGDDSDEGVDIDEVVRNSTFHHDLVDDDSAHSSIDTGAEEEQGEQELEDDFIEDDTPSRSRLPHPDIPLEFTSYASAKPRELFPHIIDWLVKNKVAPAFGRHDQLYKLAFDRIDDQVKAQAGSRLISSSWIADFKYAILARPQMKVSYVPYDEDSIHTCDACARTNHPATYEFTFSDLPYDKDSLEPLDHDSTLDADADSDSSNTAADPNATHYDAAGHALLPESHTFYLGRFCAANAEMGHKLTHWKYHLNQALLSHLSEQGVLSPEAIVSRDKMSHRKREKEAERIVDEMRDTGVTDGLWSEFKDDLEDARCGMEGHERRGGRGKNRVGTVERAAEYVW